VLGQIDSLRAVRQFEGQIDEFAIYQKALTTEDVLRHYETMAGARRY
ncbi:MAG: hypothetical protein ACIALR_17505, partial [Blastopirellula sp. JB062]